MKYTFFFIKNKLIKGFIFLSYVIILIYLLMFSRQNYLTSKEVVQFWINVLIPSLLPFLLFSEILISTNISNYFSKIFGTIISFIFKVPKISSISIIIGFLCGYPNGAKSVIELYSSGKISKDTANKLLAFTNNCNPVFLVSSVGIAIFADIYAGFLFICSHYIASIIIGLFFPCSNIIHDNDINVKKKDEKNYISANKFNIKQEFSLKNCIIKSFNTLILILGFSIVFNLAANMISTLSPLLFKNTNTQNVFNAIINGVFEMPTGILKISKLDIPYLYKMCITSFVISFSSLSVLLQIYSVISEYRFKFKNLLLYKFIHGILSFILTYILISNFVIFQSPYI